LKIRNRIQYAFRYVDDELNYKEVMEWYTSKVIQVSNGHNLKQSFRYYCKNGAIEI